jgi:AraC family transcriptional regulator, transcriptional activator of pobA
VKHLTTITEYNREIKVAPPKNPDFLARTFEEDMLTVKEKQDPLRHEFYGIGLIIEGTSNSWHGIADFKANIIFNSPYQVISWDIVPDWKGYYVLFSQDFLMNCHFGSRLLIDFPFLTLDKVQPIDVPQESKVFLQRKFEQILEEYNSDHQDKFLFIESYLNLLLLSIKRFSSNSQAEVIATDQNRSADLMLLSRYQALIENNFASKEILPEYFATSHYAEHLAIHPNHLNAITKRITGNTAKQIIQNKIIQLAKSMLLQTDFSIKEIAYKLGYEEAAHFNNFFKKAVELSPLQFRQTGKI